jgi:apolipoprotein N-acyltransferase
VIGPDGREVFRQVKSVPVQFLDDGRPAASQDVWHSPWGPIGIAICYDLSYRRVVDRLACAGAMAIVAPTMDAIAWGEREHLLHAKVAPVRARELGIPILRVASSGISQLVAWDGRVVASAPYPGQGEIVTGTLKMHGPALLPRDHWLAMPAVAAAAALTVWLVRAALRRRGIRDSGA